MKIHPNNYDREYPFIWTSKRFYGWEYKRNQYYYNRVIFKIIHRVIRNNIGKSFNLTFRYFCKKYSNIRQDLFLNEFVWSDEQYKKYSWRYLVKDGIIYDSKPFRYKKDRSITFQSFNYKEELLHKVKLTPPISKYSWDITSAYDYFITEGFKKQFESKKDKEFIRLMYEKNQAIKRNERLLKIEKKNKEYSFLSKSELEKLKSKDLDIIKRDSKGFNEESFKGDFYHGRKNKRKNKTI